MQHTKNFYISIKTQTTQLNQVSQLKKNRTHVYSRIHKLKTIQIQQQNPAFQLKFKVWNKLSITLKKKKTQDCMHQKPQSSKTETYNRSHAPPLILFSIFKQITCSFLHGRKEYILNAETTKHSVCYLIFTRNRKKKKKKKKTMKPEPAKKKVPLIKRTLPYVFFTLSSAPISRNYSYVMLQLHRDAPTKRKQGWWRPLKPIVSHNNRTRKLNQPLNSKSKHGMTHHFWQRGASHIHMKAKHLKTKPNTENVAPALLFSNL